MYCLACGLLELYVSSEWVFLFYFKVDNVWTHVSLKDKTCLLQALECSLKNAPKNDQFLYNSTFITQCTVNFRKLKFYSIYNWLRLNSRFLLDSKTSSFHRLFAKIWIFKGFMSALKTWNQIPEVFKGSRSSTNPDDNLNLQLEKFRVSENLITIIRKTNSSHYEELAWY